MQRRRERQAWAGRERGESSVEHALLQMWRLFCAALGTCVITPSLAFVLPNYPEVARWTFPADPLLSDGLGRSLTYAVDPDICSVFLPHVSEANRDMFALGCADLHETIARAFATWSSQNPYISFFNVSHLCMGAGKSCGAAEIYVMVSNATVNLTTPTVQTELTTTGDVPRTTEGKPGAPGERTITKAVITVFSPKGSAPGSWYLDTSLCHGFLTANYNVNALLAFFFAVGLIVALALVVLWLWELCCTGRFGNNAPSMPESENKDVMEGMFSLPAPVMAKLPHCGGYSLVALFMLILSLLTIPAVTLTGYLQPCLQKKPFEPALLHGIGLALGFGNVSEPDVKHMHMANADNWCMSGGSTRLAMISENKDFDVNASSEENKKCTRDTWYTCINRGASVMLSAEPLHTRTTLAQDDIDALGVLYPTDYRTCFARKTPTLTVGSEGLYAGLRMLLTFAIPLGIIAIILPCLVGGFRAASKLQAPDNKSPTPAAKAGPKPAALRDAQMVLASDKLSGREYAM